MIGNKIYSFDKLDSTNEYIKKHLSKINNGDIIFAQKQTKGRGRHGNVWISPVGNLYFSFYLDKEMHRSQLFHYLMMSSIATINTLKKININAKIKYPNDIIIDKKKIAGILLESKGYKKIEYLIIGIGINVNQTEFKELEYNAISIKNIVNETINPKEILDFFIKSYNELENKQDIYKAYLENLDIYKKNIKYKDEIYKIYKIEQDGTLYIKNDKNTKLIDYNEVSFSDMYGK